MQPPKPTGAFPQKGIYLANEDRRLKLFAIEKYGVETIFDPSDGTKPIGIAYPGTDPNDGGKMVAQKIKPCDPSRRMAWVGDHARIGFFGQNLFPAGSSRQITITEGEEDAVSFYQVLYEKSNGKYPEPVISVPDGCSSARKYCKIFWEYLNSFETIIFAFDGDEPGQKAAEDCAKLFPQKAKIVRFPDARKVGGKWQMKDANDYVKAGKEDVLINMWYKAEKYTPKGIRTFRSLWADMMKDDVNLSVPFPWEGVNKLVGGMITGKMDVLKAPPKIGKTSIFSELAHHVAENTPYKSGLILLENTAKEIGYMFCGKKMNLPLLKPEVLQEVRQSETLSKTLENVFEELSSGEKIIIFDPEDERSAENVIEKIKYLALAQDCKFIFLDHASMLAYKSEEGDERRFLDKLFADLKELTTSLDIYLCVIIHVNDDGKTRGSRAPVQLCDRLYALSRDKLSQDDTIRNTTDFIVEENRYGECGLASKLFYNQSTGRMTETSLEEYEALVQSGVNPDREVEFAE